MISPALVLVMAMAIKDIRRMGRVLIATMVALRIKQVREAKGIRGNMEKGCVSRGTKGKGEGFLCF